MVRKRGSRWPRSRSPISVRWSPAAAPSASWERPRSIRIEAASSGSAPNDQSLDAYLEQASDEMARMIEDNSWLGDDEVQGVVDEAIQAVSAAGCTSCAERLREGRPG